MVLGTIFYRHILTLIFDVTSAFSDYFFLGEKYMSMAVKFSYLGHKVNPTTGMDIVTIGISFLRILLRSTQTQSRNCVGRGPSAMLCIRHGCDHWGQEQGHSRNWSSLFLRMFAMF